MEKGPNPLLWESGSQGTRGEITVGGIAKGKGKVFPLQARCGPEGG